MVFSLGLYLLSFGAFVAVFSTYLYLATGLAYRQRDNGLAYIVLVLGVGIWNGMLVAQLLSAQPVVKGFFLSLDIVGALLAGLGWFLFAGTASSTPSVPNQRVVYGAAAILIGIDIVLAATAPAHTFYWVLLPESASAPFAVIAPQLGYWLHTLLLVTLFSAGTVLFTAGWRAGNNSHYSRTYAVLGAVTVAAVVGSNVAAPGGFSIAPLLAAGLTTTGWLQAQRVRVADVLRSLRVWRVVS